MVTNVPRKCPACRPLPLPSPRMGEPLQPVPPGWYDDPKGVGKRYWDGYTWTDHLTTPMPSAQREELLNRVINDYVGNGWRVENRSQFQAVMVCGSEPMHVVHALLTIFTCCLWAIVWAIVAAAGGEQRKVISVGPYGEVAA